MTKQTVLIRKEIPEMLTEKLKTDIRFIQYVSIGNSSLVKKKVYSQLRSQLEVNETDIIALTF